MNREAASCHERIRSLYGNTLTDDAGVLQVISTWSAPTGESRVIALGASAPASPTDRFILNLARSRADAIVTTGSILRAEPGVTHTLQGPSQERAEFKAWRREALLRTSHPVSVILTRDEGINLDHPLFSAGNPCVIYTQTKTARHLQKAADKRGVEVIGRDEPSLRSALKWLREQREARTVSIEAGPHATRPLYESPLAVQEILLSIYEETELMDTARGPLFFSPDELEAKGFSETSRLEVAEPSGRWSFRRMLRASR